MLAHATNDTIVDLNRGCLPFRFHNGRESNLKIPKRVHFIWIGSDIPEKYVLNILRIREHNPEYEFNLWMDRAFDHAEHAFAIHLANFQTVVQIRDLPLIRNFDLYSEETNLGARADILRYEIVYRFGGVYLDVDHESLGPGSLHPDMQYAFVQASGEPWCNTTNSDFGFAAGSDFMAYVIESLRDPRVRKQPEIPARTGPTFFTTCVVSFGDERIVHPNGAELLKLLRHTGDHNWR